MAIRIPFNKPRFIGRELEYVRQAVESGHISGDGGFTRRVQEHLAAELGAARVLLTTSCTDALELAALLCDVGPGDEVIVPAFTFVSTANAFALRGARPVFVDVRPDTLNLDERQVEKALTPRTRVLVPVHYAGVGCDMDALGAIAGAHGLRIVEDNAHGLFGRRAGRLLGTFGALATLSFHETKNFTCGEGGALVVNDPALVERAEVLREKGTNRARFFRGEIDKYTWVDLGSSFLPSDVLAAFLLAQIEGRDAILRERGRIWERYREALTGWAERTGARLPVVPTGCEQAFHMFYLLMPTPAARAELIAHLRARGILAVFHYLPLHLSPMGRKLGGQPGACPITEDVSDRLVRLPFHNALSPAEQEQVIDAVTSFA